MNKIVNKPEEGWTFENVYKLLGIDYPMAIKNRPLIMEIWNDCISHIEIGLYNRRIIDAKEYYATKEHEKAKYLGRYVLHYKCVGYLETKEDYNKWYEGYKRKMQKEKEKAENASKGVYGIYINDELVYIGMTMRNFKTRLKEHTDKILEDGSNDGGMILYNLLREAEGEITMKPIIDISKLQTDTELTERDVRSMELALITEHQPIGNYLGVKKSYEYNKRGSQ